MPLELLLADLGIRSGEPDIEDFAEVFSIAKRSGGNLNDIIRRSAAVTGEKIEVKQEIQTLLSSRRYEQKIMNMVPFLIMAYLQLTSRGFFDCLYFNAAGILIMDRLSGGISGRILFIQENNRNRGVTYVGYLCRHHCRNYCAASDKQEY